MFGFVEHKTFFRATYGTGTKWLDGAQGRPPELFKVIAKTIFQSIKSDTQVLALLVSGIVDLLYSLASDIIASSLRRLLNCCAKDFSGFGAIR